MAKFFGPVGFSIGDVETESGIYKPRIVEKNYYGDIVRHTRKWDSGYSVNDDLNVTNQISIVADDFAFENCSGIKYVQWMKAKWKVLSFEPEFPRIVLNLGGVWNGDKA